MTNQILDALPGYTFFLRYFPELQRGKNVTCPFHDDQTPSLSIMENGGWRCFGCGEKGDIFAFYAKINNLNCKTGFRQVLEGIIKDFKLETKLPKQGKHDGELRKLEKAQYNIQNANSELAENILREKGWGKKIMADLKIGYLNGYIWFPIFYNRELVNIRFYDIYHRTKQKFKSIPQVELTVWTFPDISLETSETIFFFKESDLPLARTLTLPAYAITGGEGTYNKKLDQYIKDKIIYICYDTDKKGVGGEGKDPAETLANHFAHIAKQVRICRLPVTLLENGKNADFTDFILAEQDFTEIIRNAEVFKQTEVPYEDVVKKYKQVSFIESVNSENLEKDIALEALCIGTACSPYIFPKEILFYCDQLGREKCIGCIMSFSGGEKSINTIEKSSPLSLTGVSNTQLKGIINRMIYTAGCKRVRYKLKEMENLLEIFISDRVDQKGLNEQVLSQRREAFIIGNKYLTPNAPYNFEGKLVCSPNDQKATHIFDHITPIQGNLDNFKITKAINEKLKILEPETPHDVEKIINKVVDEFGHCITKTIGREDLILSVLLTFLSPLSFIFNETLIERGWMDILVIGDTGTGKSTTVREMIRHINCGSFHTCEKATLAGLLGGVANVNRTSFVVWGILPINDRGLVVMDETSGIEVEIIEKLSGVREEGIAETITVAGAASAKSRTRVIWMGNPRSKRRLMNFNAGITAVEELMGKPEDIGRLDLIVVCSSNDISVKKINVRAQKYEKEIIYTKDDLLNTLVLWAWSRKAQDIVFSDRATGTILNWAVQMAADFSEDFPLVIGSKQRLKIARVSAAVAALVHSTINDGKTLFVDNFHVDYAVAFMYKLFSNPNLGYRQFSALRLTENLDESRIKKEIEKMSHPNLFIISMLNGTSFRITDIEIFMGTSERDKAREMLTFLLEKRCLIRAKGYYYKTSGFTELLRELNEHCK